MGFEGDGKRKEGGRKAWGIFLLGGLGLGSGGMIDEADGENISCIVFVGKGNAATSSPWHVM